MRMMNREKKAKTKAKIRKMKTKIELIIKKKATFKKKMMTKG